MDTSADRTPGFTSAQVNDLSAYYFCFSVFQLFSLQSSSSIDVSMNMANATSSQVIITGFQMILFYSCLDSYF